MKIAGLHISKDFWNNCNLDWKISSTFCNHLAIKDRLYIAEAAAASILPLAAATTKTETETSPDYFSKVELRIYQNSHNAAKNTPAPVLMEKNTTAWTIF